MNIESRFEKKLVLKENLPLYGKRVLFTTPRNYAGSLGKLLLERGARLIWMPTIEIWPMQDYRELDQAIDNLSDYAWIGFTSENGIEAYCNRLAAKGIDGRSIKTTKLAAFKADARAFVPWGITPDLLPDESSPKGIIDELISRGVNSGKILVPVPEVSGVKEPYVVPEFIEQLQKIGMTTHRVAAYRTMAVTKGIDIEMRMLLNQEIDIIVFTSSAEIFSLLDQLKEKREILNNVVTAYMGKFTSKTGTIVKLRQDIVPEKYTMQDLLEAMEAYFRK
jgi:uroporphyrinogen-III synthase